MGQYPWGFTGVTPNASDNLARQGQLTTASGSSSPTTARCPALRRTTTRRWSAPSLTPDDRRDRRPVLGAAAGSPLHRHGAGRAGRSRSRPQCDDGPFGRGTGGELTYDVSLPRRRLADRLARRRRLGPGPRAGASTSSTKHAEATRPASSPRRSRPGERLADMTRLSLPGDPLVAAGGRLGQAEHRRPHPAGAATCRSAGPTRASSSRRRSAPCRKATWIGAGYPDYPWIFGTDAEYTAFAAVSVGQFEAIEGHLRALREVSDLLNNRSGVVTHEVVSDGSIWFGHDSRQTNPDGTTTYDFNTDETVKFPSTVALVWRWTGDNAFLNEMYDFTVRNLHYVVTQPGRRPRRLARGPRQRRAHRDGAGEAGQHRLLHPRALRPGRHGAGPSTTRATYRWATNLARLAAATASTTPGGTRPRAQYADSLRRRTTSQSFQKHWIGQTPMEAELHVNGQTVPGLAPCDHGTTALAGRENDCYSGIAPAEPRAVPHRLRRRARTARARRSSSG